MSLTVIGQRIYIEGNTYSVRDQIKAIGGHWDGERRAWWVGAVKRAEAEALVATLAASPASAAATSQDRRENPDSAARVIARATYKAKDYYVLAESRDRGRLLLAARNGAFQFWAAREAAQVTKTYGRANDRTGRTEYPTLGSMIRRAEQWRQMSAEDRADAREDAAARQRGETCPCSGGACRCGTDSPCCMCW